MTQRGLTAPSRSVYMCIQHECQNGPGPSEKSETGLLRILWGDRLIGSAHHSPGRTSRCLLEARRPARAAVQPRAPGGRLRGCSPRAKTRTGAFFVRATCSTGRTRSPSTSAPQPTRRICPRLTSVVGSARCSESPRIAFCSVAASSARARSCATRMTPSRTSRSRWGSEASAHSVARSPRSSAALPRPTVVRCGPCPRPPAS